VAAFFAAGRFGVAFFVDRFFAGERRVVVRFAGGIWSSLLCLTDWKRVAA
jgi:hypothetical protein